MSDFRIKLKRQIEILNLVLNSSKRYLYTDLEDIFDCERITIKRDLQELRKFGIGIYFSKKKGIFIDNKITPQLLSDFINQYISLSSIYSDSQKATKSLVRSLTNKSLDIIIQIQKCINEKKTLRIIYRKSKTEIKERTVEPAVLFVGDNEWRLVAREDFHLKQFFLYKITKIEILNKRAKPIDKKEIDNILNSSLFSWLDTKHYEVVLEFLPDYGSRALPFIVDDQQFIDNSKSRIVKIKVNSLEEAARYVLSRCGDVIVHEPQELKNLILEYSKIIFNSYNK
ncbi:MAG: WYL domain-containing protein [Ignavibacteriales bacterium]|nr:WYL domain-containing protein [Ignavibacteriales bacterium]